jgi:hypothetical protein
MKYAYLVILNVMITVLPQMAYAEATVKLSNYDSLMPVYYREVGKLAYGEDFYIEVFGGPPGSTGFLITPVGATSPIIKLKEPGFFDAGIGIIPEAFDNGDVNLRVRGWYGSPSYEQAASAGLAGQTFFWSQIAGSWNPGSGLTPTGPSLEMPWPLEIGFAIPEPSTVALIVLGAGILLGATRMKNGR